jgi:hypothetical protein
MQQTAKSGIVSLLQLWGALQRWRRHQHELCQIDRAPGEQQALLQKQQMQWTERGCKPSIRHSV